MADATSEGFGVTLSFSKEDITFFDSSALFMGMEEWALGIEGIIERDAVYGVSVDDGRVLKWQPVEDIPEVGNVGIRDGEETHYGTFPAGKPLGEAVLELMKREGVNWND